MTDTPFGRLTPWVTRLLAINAVILLLQMTVVPSPALRELLEFNPALAGHRPWTFFTYMFQHASLLHLGGNALALLVFGPPVERRFGSARFLAFYLYCGLGAAFVSLLLNNVVDVGKFIGASGAIMGVAYAFARFNPDVELMVFPFPMPLKAKRLVLLFVALDIAGAVIGGDNIAHLAHLGGIASALCSSCSRELHDLPTFSLSRRSARRSR